MGQTYGCQAAQLQGAKTKAAQELCTVEMEEVVYQISHIPFTIQLSSAFYWLTSFECKLSIDGSSQSDL